MYCTGSGVTAFEPRNLSMNILPLTSEKLYKNVNFLVS